MKRVFLIITVLFNFSVFSQRSTVYIDEDFSGGVPPTDKVAEGTYLLTLSDGENTRTKKIVITR